MRYTGAVLNRIGVHLGLGGLIVCGALYQAVPAPVFVSDVVAGEELVGMALFGTTTTTVEPMLVAALEPQPAVERRASTVLSNSSEEIRSVPFSQFADISAPEWRKVGCGIASTAMIIDFFNPEKRR